MGTRSGMIGPLAVGLLQVLLVAALLADPARLLAAPIRSLDYAAHFYNALHTAEHLRSSGRPWGYDPFWMMGYPQGFVALIDDKLFCLLLLVAPRGWEAAVFNAGVLGILLAVPWLLHSAARAAGLEPSERCAAALAAIVVTFTVPASVLFWSWGGLSFFFTSVLAVPVTVMLATTLSDGSLWSARGIVGSLAAMLVVFTHPMGAPILGAGLLPALWCGTRPLRSRLRDLAIVGILLALTVLPIVEATFWLRGPLRFSHPAHESFRGGFGQLILDWWTNLFDTTSRRNGAGGSLVILPLALWGALVIRRELSDPRNPKTAGRRVGEQAVLVALLCCAATAYALSSFLERTVRLQPYRFIIPMSFFACVPAGVGIARWGRSLARGSATSWALAVGALVVVFNAARGLTPMLVLGHGHDLAEVELAAFVERETTGEDRILVESTATPLWVEGRLTRAILSARFALLPTVVRREFLGYIGVEPFAAPRYARFDGLTLLGERFPSLSEAAFDVLLGRHAISWVVGCNPATLEVLARFSASIEAAGGAADCRIFRVRAPQRSRFLEGSGRVSADIDRIEVKDARGDRIVLKYHWLPTLRTDPPLPIEEARQPGMPVGFIAVRPGGAHDFTIRPRGVLEFATARSSAPAATDPGDE